MFKRLADFAVFMGFRPADVWALTTEEWTVLAPAIDQLREQADRVHTAGR